MVLIKYSEGSKLGFLITIFAFKNEAVREGNISEIEVNGQKVQI